MPRKKKDAASESVPVAASPAPTEASAPTKSKKPGGRPKGSKNKIKKSAAKSTGPMRYDAAIKAKILAAAKGKPLAAAHAAAIGVGYLGTPASLYQMLRNAGVTGKKGKKPGRPKGSKNSPKAAPTIRRGPGRPPKAAAQVSGGLSAIEQIVARDVQSRVNAAARAAIAELEKLIK